MNHPSAFSGLRAGAKAAAPGAPMRLGSGEHLSLFCRMLLDTHDPHRPAIMDWPALEKEARIDSFFAFGLFDAAKRTGFFPESLVDTFEPVIQEEARHILFFVNWVAWHRRTMPWWRRPFFELKVVRVWLFLIWERIGIARNVGNGVQNNNFTVTGANQLGADIAVGDLVRICLSENDRRMSHYDGRLLRPSTVPALARFALCFMRSSRKDKHKRSSCSTCCGGS